MSRTARFICASGLACAAAWCENPSPQILRVRLDTHLTSYATDQRSGFRSTAIAALEDNAGVLIVPGSIVYGTVRRASAVGLGLARERASLELQFDEYELPDGRRFRFEARLESIDNAREEVTSQGRIKGVLAARAPQGWLQGVWHRPSAGLFPRSLIGLTGASGHLWTKYALGPVGAAALLVCRFAVFRLPEPEIHLPPGTEMKLLVTRLPADAPLFPTPPPAAVPDSLAAWLKEQPHEVTKPNGKLSADIVNLAFVGSREQLVQAFASAGWFPAEPLTRRSFSRAYRAYTSMRGYPTAPVSKLLYDGVEPDSVFQKSLNTITKRHHVRIWRADAFAGQDVWLGAATHDTGVAFNPAALTITHLIDAMIDTERTKIVDDLAFAGCAMPAAYLGRPEAVRSRDNGKGIVTDGRLAVISLVDCAGRPKADSPASPKLPGSRVSRLGRRVALETRHYLLRGNPYYWGYRAARWRPADPKPPTTIEE